MIKISCAINKILTSKPVKKTIEFASDNPALLASVSTFALSTIVRPSVIMLTPKTDRQDKKYAVSKSLTSSAVGLGLTYAVSKPIEIAVKNIDKNPKKFLNTETIKNLKGNNEILIKSKKYLFATQFIKNSTGMLTALPKSMLTCAILPFVAKIFDKNNVKQNISFGSNERLSKGIGNILNSKFIKKMTEKFSDTNLIQNMAVATDILLTGIFVNQVKKSKDIPEKNKKPLINNSIFSTGLSVLGSVGLNKLSDKPTEKFIKHFLKLNNDIKNPEKYAQGIRTIKTIGILGGIYYAIIPFISTLFSSVIKNSEDCRKDTI